ncbi:MAG TPA: hypothetical protein DEP53_14405 [Bacteroidetes bacterium]|nr:hypothetical protein [Bacteroidota bacterium]
MRSSIPILLATIALFSCAGQRAPEGGPIDTDPPVVISTIPPNYTTRFSGRALTIEFSEYIDPRSLEGALFISPSLGPLTFDWSGREVEIEFNEDLRRNTTYVVTIGTDVADLNNKNKMAQAFTLAFTTGEDIDHGAIEGRVFTRLAGDSPQGVTIAAYRLNDIKPDTLDPRNTRPDYVTQTGKNGEFILRHLAFGSYRVIALRDEFKNLLYDPETDDYGIAGSDASLTPHDTLRSNVWMRLVREDTTALRLLKVTAQTRHVLRAEFSAPIVAQDLPPSWIRIADTVARRALSVLAVSPVFPQLKSVIVVTDSQEADMPYRLEVDSLRSQSGLGMNPLARSLVFSGSVTPDTLGPSVVSCSTGDSARGVELESPILIHFSVPVEKTGSEKAITVIDSGRISVPYRYRWISGASVELKPEAPLKSKVWHSIRIRPARIYNLHGKPGKDSLRVFRFQTIDRDLFSTIEGAVRDTGSIDVGGPIKVTAQQAAAKEAVEYTVRLEHAGAFILKDIPEGKYLLRAYRDRNGNDRFDPGRLFPYKPSERFTQYADTLKVRARWPLEGATMWLR